ncbi:MAG: hypothetical protein QOD06_552 [Candidatus Binatota bacterium]|jgi:type II secretion system protein N|nr:hypothetical protein [Candidatus Binatota bacterium]
MASIIGSVLARLGRLVPRGAFQRATMGYVAYTLVLFLAFFLYTFPHELVVHGIVARLTRGSDWRILYREVSLVPWAGYRIDELRLQAPGNASAPSFRADRVSLRPAVQSFLGKGFSVVSFDARAYGGELSGSVDRSANAIADVRWRDVDLGRVPELDLLIDADWQGKFGGELHLESGESLQVLKGGGRLELRNAALVQATAQGFKIPDLHFASGEGQFEIKAGRIEISGLKLSGTEADAELRGQIYLRAPASDSVVNGTLSVRPIPGAGSTVDQLLTVMNRNQRPPGGTFTYALYGTIGRIRIR